MPYSKEQCPKCGVDNYQYHGDPDDCTSYEGEPALICWKCGAKFWTVNINDSDAIMVLECYDQWDKAKTADENLQIVEAGKGQPSEDHDSLKYEHFLEDNCPFSPALPSRVGQTWRGFLLERLHFVNGGSPFWAEKRERRCRIVEEFLRDPNNWFWNEDIAKAFKKHDIHCRKLSDKKRKKNGGSRDIGVDWVQFYRELKGLMLYMTSIDWHEIHHEDRKTSSDSADPNWQPPRKP